MSSAELEIIDIGNKIYGPSLLFHPQLLLPDLWTPKPLVLQGGWASILIVFATENEVL